MQNNNHSTSRNYSVYLTDRIKKASKKKKERKIECVGMLSIWDLNSTSTLMIYAIVICIYTDIIFQPKFSMWKCHNETEYELINTCLKETIGRNLSGV